MVHQFDLDALQDATDLQQQGRGRCEPAEGVLFLG